MLAPASMASMASPHEKHTSAEVAGVPSENCMPSRMWKVTLSGERTHESA